MNSKESSALPLQELSAPYSEKSSPPRYRWAVLFVVWGAFLLSYVDRVAWSSVAAPVGHTLGISVSMLGAFVTAFYIGYVVANVVGGILTDTFGGRLTLTLALIPLGLATFSFSLTESLSMGIGIQFVMGLFAGADYSAGVKILTAWFGKERGKAMGIYTTATSLAVVIANATVPAISISFGWETAFRLLGGLTFSWAIVSYIVVRDTPGAQAASARIGKQQIVLLLKNRNLILLSIAGCGALWGTVGFGAWSNALMTRQYGISPVTAGAIAAWFGCGAVIAKPLLGWLSDVRKGGSRLFGIACLVGFGVLLMVFGQASTETQFYMIAPFLGATAFGYTPLLIAMITEVSGNQVAGAASGLTNAIWQLGSAISPIVVGHVYGVTHSFVDALAVLAAGPLLGAVTLLFLKLRVSST
ncbi:MFS transporter [Herbaspirillum seropedicae]|uniref:MFS transporter n=1 Tax=Herbaspirillum seropedicae TaxID=964 RepID=UPI00286612DE|nr:MFS transporter [Herbaspirillum seropedicae]MDR6397496.1 sugar phosphate permease [Herbaspirillum seropedicae]